MKNLIKPILLTFISALIIIIGVVVFDSRKYAWISLCVCILACLPLFARFEKDELKVGRLIIIAVMIALSVTGRYIFSIIPGFKPVTALVVITGIYFGYEAGFLTGAFAAVISNFLFGQGPWTPFQMFAWGVIGLLAGLFAGKLKRSRIWLLIFGFIAGILYSMLLDIWSAIWIDGIFNLKRYIAALISSLPFTAMYAVSNVIFLFLLAKPLGKKLERICMKYGL